MVKRYNPELERNGGLGLPSMAMRSSHVGSWVEYKDYAALEEAYDQLQEQYDLDVNPEGK